MENFPITFKKILLAIGIVGCFHAAYAQQPVVQSQVVGNNVFIDIDPYALKANLDTLFAQGTASSAALGALTWADVLDNGTSPGIDVDFFGFDLTGLGEVVASGTLAADSLTLNKDAVVTGRLTLGNVATFADSLKVNGVVEFADSLRVVRSVSMGNQLFVTGVTSLGDSLHVVGNVDLDALFNVDGAATFGSSLRAAGVATFEDSLRVAGVAIMEDSINVAGNAHLLQDLRVDGDVNFGSSLTVMGEAAFSDTVNFSAPALFADSASFAGNVSMAGALSVSSLSINGVTIPAMDDTDDLPEGSTNLYFTDSRARAAMSGGTGVTITSGSIAIGQSVGTSDDVTFDEIAADSISASGSLTVAGRVTLSDSLHVSSGAVFQSTLVADSIHVTDVINGRVGSLSNHDTDGLNEGSTNLYFTDSRARAAMSGGTGVTITSGSIAIGQSVGTTDDVTFDEIAADSISASGSLTVAGRVTLSDSLHVSSGAVFQSTLVADSIVSSGLSLNGGVRIQDGNQAVGKVLTSDAQGNATWQAATSPYTAGTGVDVTSNVISIGQAVGTTDDVTFDDLNVDSVMTAAFRLQNGTQGLDYILTSDANGNARWKESAAAKSPVFGVFNPTAPINPINSADYCTGAYIDLPSGSWAVNIGLIMQVSAAHTGGYWVRTQLSTDCAAITPPTYITGGPTMVAGVKSSHSPFGFLTGTIMVNNTGTSTQRLYLWRTNCAAEGGADPNYTLVHFARGVFGEDFIYAMPMNN